MHKNDFFPFIFFSYHSFSLSYLEPQIIFPCRDIGPATATLDPRPRLWTRDPRPATISQTPMVTSYVSLMKQKYISYWQNTLQHSQKLEFYWSFKTDHSSSSYLDLTRGTAGRRALVKLQISNHKLMIELGGYNRTTTKDKRHCSFCGSNLTDDELHFLFHRPT